MANQTQLPGQTEVFRPGTQDELAALETRLGLPLPPRYRRFLETVNGGCFSYCRVYTGDIADAEIRPAPYDLELQDMQTTALPPKSTVSLYHDTFLNIIRWEEGTVLLLIGSMTDASLLFVHCDAARADQIWVKTPDMPTWDGHDYPSEWFYLNENIDEFLKRLHHVPD